VAAGLLEKPFLELDPSKGSLPELLEYDLGVTELVLEAPDAETLLVSWLEELVFLMDVEGEIVIRGSNLLKEYWRNEEATRKSFVDGWFRTGDICKRDEDGYICIVGRSKDIIISGGVNLHPREIEEVVESMPEVREAAVVGVPDEEFGESVKACVVLEDGAELSTEEVIAYCRERLASFKKPKHVEFLNALPKNAMGKIVKEELRGNRHS